VRALDGSCLIAPTVILLADALADLIWRVDLSDDGHRATAGIWLAHHSMAFNPDSPLKPTVPGINGVRYAAQTHFLYYTSTAQKLFMRVRVDPATHQPAGEPELVAGGTMSDDFCLDEDASVAYLTTHRQNTIDRVSLTPARQPQPRDIVAGDPFTDELIGPTSAAWGRTPDDYGRVAYVTTDGGTAAPPPDGTVRPAKILSVELEPAAC